MDGTLRQRCSDSKSSKTQAQYLLKLLPLKRLDGLSVYNVKYHLAFSSRPDLVRNFLHVAATSTAVCPSGPPGPTVGGSGLSPDVT